MNLSPPDTLGQNEVDSAAESSCAGLNWMPLLCTGDVANVFGFNGAETDTAIPIATCATKVIAKSGIPYILICPQMLYYGAKMQRSLLNPNQLWHEGTIVGDDPTTDGEDFGLTTKNLFVPFETSGAAIYFESFAPTHDEVEEFVHQIIGPEEWNPQTVRMRDYPVSDRRAIEIAALRSSNQASARELCFDNPGPVGLEKEKVLITGCPLQHLHCT